MKTIFLFCGSFNPIHIGHLNIAQKAVSMFGKENVIICQGVNPSKESENRDSILYKKILQSFRTREYFCFTHEIIKDYVADGLNVVLIKGLRNGDDLAYENNQVSFIKDFYSNLNVIYIPCDKEFEYISSSAIRQLESFEPGSGEKYILK